MIDGEVAVYAVKCGFQPPITFRTYEMVETPERHIVAASAMNAARVYMTDVLEMDERWSVAVYTRTWVDDPNMYDYNGRAWERRM